MKTDRVHPLVNAERDAEMMAHKFVALHFDIACYLSVDSRSLTFLADAIAEHDPDEGMVVFYFAGHGFSYSGRNFIVGSEKTDQTDQGIYEASRDPVQLLQKMAAKKAHLLLLDSCRDELSPPGNAAGLASGFNTGQSVGSGGMVHFAAQNGGTAYDWATNAHGLYATVFDRDVTAETLPAEDSSTIYAVLGDVGDDVHATTISDPNFTLRVPQLEQGTDVVFDRVAFDSSTQSIVDGAQQFISGQASNPVLDSDLGLARQACRTARRWTRTLATIDDRDPILRPRVAVARDALDSFNVRRNCDALFLAQPVAVEVTSVQVPVVPVSVQGRANVLLGPNQKWSDRADLAPLFAANFADLAIYDPNKRIAYEKALTGTAPSVQVPVATDSLAARVVALLGSKRVLAAPEKAPGFVETSEQIRVCFASTEAATFDSPSAMKVVDFIKPQAGTDPEYAIIMPPTMQGPHATASKIRLSENRLIELQQLVAKGGTRLSALLLPDLTAPPSMQFSDLGPDQIAIIRLLNESEIHGAPTNDDIRNVTPYSKELQSYLSAIKRLLTRFKP